MLKRCLCSFLWLSFFFYDGQGEPTVRELSTDPVRIGIFNGAQYDAHVMINYIYDDLQKETELDSRILEEEERTMFLPHNVTNIRIRVSAIGLIHDGNVIDEQILNFDQIKERCYVLAGTRSRSIYGLCPVSFEKMLAK